MKKIVKTTYRLEDRVGLGLFTSDDSGLWESEWDLESVILENMGNILTINTEFSWDEEKSRKHFCAFNSFSHMIEIIPLPYLKRLEKLGFKIVKVKGKMLQGKTQIFFEPHKVRKDHVPFSKIEMRLARKTAMKELKKEFQSLSVSDYIITD